MWFLLFSLGAVMLGVVGLPAARHLPVAPPPEALVACYFLVAALVRLLVRDARLAAFERKARREARRREDGKQPSVLGEIGLGVGRGALQAVGGDLLGAGLSLATALLRGAASSVSAPPTAQRERRRAARRERVRATACVLGVGVVCAGVAWEPLVRSRMRRATDAAMRAAAGPARPSGAAMAATMTATPGAPAEPGADRLAARPEPGHDGAEPGGPTAAEPTAVPGPEAGLPPGADATATLSSPAARGPDAADPKDAPTAGAPAPLLADPAAATPDARPGPVQAPPPAPP